MTMAMRPMAATKTTKSEADEDLLDDATLERPPRARRKRREPRLRPEELWPTGRHADEDERAEGGGVNQSTEDSDRRTKPAHSQALFPASVIHNVHPPIASFSSH